MTDEQSKAATGKKRGPYQIEVPRTFGGRGKMKCAICGRPIIKHKTMALCTLKRPATVAYHEDKKHKRSEK